MLPLKILMNKSIANLLEKLPSGICVWEQKNEMEFSFINS